MQETLDMNGNWKTQSEANCELSGLSEKKSCSCILRFRYNKFSEISPTYYDKLELDFLHLVFVVPDLKSHQRLF